MSLLTGDDYPEAFHPPDPEQPAPASDLRRRPGPRGKRHDWPRWRGRRRRSMLIQDPPDLAGDGEDGRYGVDDSYGIDKYSADNGYGADGGYGADNGYGSDYCYEAGPRLAERILRRSWSRPGRLSAGWARFPWLSPGGLSRRPDYRGPLSGIWLRRFSGFRAADPQLQRRWLRGAWLPGLRLCRGLLPHIRVLAIAMLPIRIPVTPPLGIPARRIPAIRIPGPATWQPGTRPRATTSWAAGLEDHPLDDGQAYGIGG